MCSGVFYYNKETILSSPISKNQKYENKTQCSARKTYYNTTWSRVTGQGAQNGTTHPMIVLRYSPVKPNFHNAPEKRYKVANALDSSLSF